MHFIRLTRSFLLALATFPFNFAPTSGAVGCVSNFEQCSQRAEQQKSLKAGNDKIYN